MLRFDESTGFRRQLRLFVALVVLTFTALGLRLAYLQISHAHEYTRRAQDNWLEEQRVPALRGMIVDAKGKVLAKNRPSYDLYVTPRFVTPESLERATRLLALTVEEGDELRARLENRKGMARYRSLRVLRDLDRDQFARIETERLMLDGVRVEVSTQRQYPEGPAAAHVLGFMNEVSAGEIGASPEGDYLPGDLLGRAGVERMFESALRGRTGTRSVVADARGSLQGPDVVRRLGLGPIVSRAANQEARPGHTVVLTIDLDLQKAVEKTLRGHASGVVVVLEVQTGRVLAMASRPAFDPSVMTGRLTGAAMRRLETDPYRPLIDKTVREDYFPGSIYKVIPAIAALEDDAIEPRRRVRCSGSHELGRRVFRCTRPHGMVDLSRAIVQSCNVYFYRLAELVGMDRMAEIAAAFGLGAPTGLGLNGEVGGFVPTKSWYLANSKEGFRLGFTLNTAIGQGSTKVTVLQMALLYATIANGGQLFVPQIVRRVETADGRVVQDFPPRLRRLVPASPETLAFLRSALTEVVSDPQGTAFEARPRDAIKVAGKTGTAQVRRRQLGLPDDDHAWFVAFAPPQDPQISVAVLIEHGGVGSKVAAPVAMEVIRAYFRGANAGAPGAP